MSRFLDICSRMATILNHTVQPLWVWIVVILIGSIGVMLVVLVAALGWRRRSKIRQRSQPSPSLTPMRKVTIRRGRVVTPSRYLSLTGSRFGLGQLAKTEEKDQAAKGRERSRSPFMWWLSSLQDRAQSEQSHVLGDEPRSTATSPLERTQPSPVRHHTRHASATSGCSSPSIIDGRELAEDAEAAEEKTTLTANPTTAPNFINFSRCFSPTGHPTPSDLECNVLPQIVEAPPTQPRTSPHGDEFSLATASFRPPPQPLSRQPPLTPLRGSHTSRSLNEADRMLRASSGHSVTTWMASEVHSDSLPHSTDDITRPRSTPNMRHHSPARKSHPRPLPPDLTASLADDSISSNPPPIRPASVMEKRKSRETIVQVSRMSSYAFRVPDSPPSPRAAGESVAYWEQRPDAVPVRTPSKKGNVLRKKSLVRAAAVSSVGG